jgi:cell division protein ZapE
MMSPLTYYQQQLDSGLIQKDPQQLAVIHILDNIYFKLIKQTEVADQWLSRWRHPQLTRHAVTGLYVWGSVGVGKTLLMDIFYDCLPVKKRRSHFHEFMRDIHQQLKQHQGEKNPLARIAKTIAQDVQVLCFDEMMVDDIADAMILGNLFQALFQHRICLITSSNVAPDDLYKNGLQRELFYPAIALIKKHTDVFHMISHHDYRVMSTAQAGVYFTPLNQQAAENMEKCFQYFAQQAPVSTDAIDVLDRKITIHKQANDTIWFDFFALCDIPRSQNDYLVLAKKYKTVLISNIPVMSAEQNNLITAFIHLIDIFYDANVRVVISAAAPVEALYPAGRLRFAFARTQSRLIEMQSIDYFASDRL